MAKLNGFIKLEGTLDNLTFYKGREGYLVRTKGGISKERMKSDPAFQRTRENGSEFGRAGKGGKLVRNAIRILLLSAKDKLVTSRLTTDLLKVVKSDLVNERGMRTIQDGSMSLLSGFEFNINAKLGSTLFAAYSNDFDRVTGVASVNIPSFSPLVRIAAPTGTTHFKIVTGSSELDFANEIFTFESDETAILPYDSADTGIVDFVCALTPNSTLPVIQVLGVEFYQEVNGQMYPLKNGSFNALAIVNIDTV